MAELPISTTINFLLRQRPGQVVARYGVNDDPARWGYPLLQLAPLVQRSRGFPVVQAEVLYPGEGYGAVLAWVQVIRSSNTDSGERADFVDRAPQLQDLDLPYFSFGVRPVLFDAPSTMVETWSGTPMPSSSSVLTA